MKQYLTAAAVTFVVVLGALWVYNKYVNKKTAEAAK